MPGKRSFDAYRMPDALWERIEPLLPKYRVSRRGSQPRPDLPRVVDAIFYCARAGCHWKALPPELCPGSTAYQDFQEWQGAGVECNVVR